MTEPQEPLITGTVLRAAGGGVYEVHVSDNTSASPIKSDGPDTQQSDIHHAGEPLLCTLRGKFKRGRREAAQPISVGDEVSVRALTSFGADARGRRLREGYIEEALPRRSSLGRARYQKTAQVALANLDQVAIVMSLRDPALNTHRLDRFLVLAEAADLRAIICLNKCDLLSKREMKAEIEPLQQLYGGIGYTMLPVSAVTDSGIKALRAQLKNHISAFIGSSGVGKSSLAMAVQPDLELWVGEVMDMGKGRHTTTEVTLHPLDFGGYIADTPGVKTVTLLEQEEVNLPLCFPEFSRFTEQCRFNNCSHVHEPGCAVRAAVESGEIASQRYESYSRMLSEATPKTYKKA